MIVADFQTRIDRDQREAASRNASQERVFTINGIKISVLYITLINYKSQVIEQGRSIRRKCTCYNNFLTDNATKIDKNIMVELEANSLKSIPSGYVKEIYAFESKQAKAKIGKQLVF
ncbi:hypothetical protein NQ315_016336 [Exocentrus adspersus]|uniref:Uncharacterized protein n=1 Tax=Exocentrus adspersus TaxID=1586481 RepID=A0AAV8VQB3_9CUCU|nr:hypothetical protein NQ315_016336 [Exocentrus adspersus]